jgi:4-amino-4-deoxy-L-arabinose transferase-like glycosyltransferase
VTVTTESRRAQIRWAKVPAARRARTRVPHRASWWPYIYPVLAGLVVRLLIADVAAEPAPPRGADQSYYRFQAEQITRGHWFVDPGTVLHGSAGSPGAAHPPLFSAVLALADLLGLQTVNGQRAFLCVLSVSAVVLCGRIGARLDRRTTEMTVAWMAALLPGMWIYSGQDLSETITIPLVAGAILALYRLRESPTVWRAFTLGALVALCSLTRPELLLLLVVFAPIWFLAGSWKRRLALTAAFLAVVVLLVGPWVGRNLNDYRDTEILSANLGSVIVGANCGPTYSGPLMGAWDIRCVNAVHLPRGDISTDDHFEQTVGLRYAGSHGTRVPLVVAARLGRSLGVWPTPAAQVSWNATAGGVWPEWASWLYLVTWVLSIPVVVVAVRTLRRRRIVAWPLYAMIALFLVVSGLLYADPRFASSCQPALAVLVGIGVARAVSVATRSGRGRHAKAPNPIVDGSP